MFRIFLCCLSLFAISLVVGQAVAGGNVPAYSSGVVITETIVSSSSASPEDNMQPIAGDPGVMVAPVDESSMVPVVVEEDVMIETEGE